MTVHAHDFPTSVLIRTLAGVEVIELHDPDNGYLIGDEIVLPPPNKRQRRRKYARVGGSYGFGPFIPDDGTLIVPISVLGTTWPLLEAAYEDLLAAVQSEVEFYIDVALSGVTRRYYTDAPVDIFPSPVNAEVRILNSLDYELRFLVQPSPVIVTDAESS